MTLKLKQAGFAHIVLFLVFLMISLGIAGYFFIFSNSVKAVYVTDNNSEGVGVVWQTKRVAQTYLIPDSGWKTQLNAFLPATQKASDVIGVNSKTHLSRIKNLEPNKTYAFRIVVNGIVKDKIYVKTAPALGNIPTPTPLLAQAFDENGSAFDKGVVIAQFVSKNEKTKFSTILASKINKEGKYALDLSNVRSSNLQEGYKYEEGRDVLSLTALTDQGVSTITLKLSDALTLHKVKFHSPKTAFLVKNVLAREVCETVTETQEVCEVACRSCAGDSKDDAGCDGDEDHPDICDGKECRQEEISREVCREEPEPVREEPKTEPAGVEDPPSNESIDGGGNEEAEGATFDIPAAEPIQPTQPEVTLSLSQGSAGVEIATTFAEQPTSLQPAITIPISSPTPSPTPTPSPPQQPVQSQAITGVFAGAESKGVNIYEIVGSVRGNARGSDLQWQVDFGDGTNSSLTSKNPLRVSKTYSQSGIYTVTVTVIDSNGKSYTDRVAVSVQRIAPVQPVNSLTSIVPPPASPQSSEESVAVDLNKQEIITIIQGARVISNALTLLQGVEGKPVNSGTVSVLYANRTKGKAIVIKDGKITETFDIDPATGKRVSLRRPSYLASAAPAVLGISTEQNTIEVTQLTNGQLAISIPEGEAEITVEDSEGNEATARGFLKSGKLYQIEPNLAGSAGQIRMSGGSFILEEGWNLIALNVTPKKDYMAEDMLSEINAEGGKSVAVNRWINNKWQTHVVGNFGTNFKIEVGHGYFVYTKKASTWLIPAQNDVVKPDVLVDPGWNLLATTNLSINKASELLNHINTNSQPSVNADTVTQYVNNLWQSIKVKDNTVFGKDFEVTNRRSYFVKVQNQGVWKSR